MHWQTIPHEFAWLSKSSPVISGCVQLKCVLTIKSYSVDYSVVFEHDPVLLSRCAFMWSLPSRHLPAIYVGGKSTCVRAGQVRRATKVEGVRVAKFEDW